MNLAAAGTGAGITAIYRSPIGGVLWAYENCAPPVFWSFELCWLIFYTCAISCFTVNVLKSWWRGSWDIANAGVIQFREFDYPSYEIIDIPGFVFIGVLGGIMGVIFAWIGRE
jgi:chloride channel 7